MDNLQQEPWTQEEWDAYIQYVIAQGEPEEGDDLPVHQVIERTTLACPRWNEGTFNPNHPVPAEIRADPQHPLNVIQQKQEE